MDRTPPAVCAVSSEEAERLWQLHNTLAQRHGRKADRELRAQRAHLEIALGYRRQLPPARLKQLDAQRNGRGDE